MNETRMEPGSQPDGSVHGGGSAIPDQPHRQRDSSARASIDTSTGPRALRIKGVVGRSEDSGPRISAPGSQNAAPKRRGRAAKTSIGGAAVPGAGIRADDSAQRVPADTGAPDGPVRRGAGVSEEAAAKARNLFRDIGERFNKNRKQSKASAYEAYQRDLMDNLDTFVLGGVIQLKEITSTITDLEVFMRSNTGETGKSQAQLLAEWLQVDPTEILSIGATISEE